MLKKTLGPALCGALLLALAGCSGDKDLEKPVEAPEIANSIDVQEIWSHSLGSSDSAEFYSRLAPAVSGGTVFAAGRDGDVYAMDLASGDTRWSVDLSDEEENDDRRSARLSGGVAASPLKAAVGSENGWIYVMNAADGKLSWKQYVGAEVVSVPAFSQDGARLFVLDSRGLVTAYDSATGAQLWQGGDSSGTLRLRSQPRPVAVGNKALLLGTRSGKVLILSQSDGGLLNSVTVGTPAGSNDLERVADVAGTPLLLGSELYTSAYNSGFVWYSFNDRAVVNRLGYHSSRDLAFDGSRFVIVGDDGHISCISRQDGHELWQNAQLTNRNVSSPAIYGEYAVVGDMEGYVYFLDLGTGRIVFMDSTDDSPVTAAPLVTANGVLVQTSGSDLYLFRHAQSAASSKLAEANAELASAGAGVNFAADGYDVSGGDILINGKSIKDYTLYSYRNKFGTVFQDFQLYAANIAENVLTDEYSESDQPRVLEALKSSGFEERLSSLKDGIHTPLTKEFDQSGINLSGGEAQKVAISRVFAKDCEIVILDEPSSALDPMTEYELNNTLMTALEKTVIIISHRLSTTRMADVIYMLENGKIIEQGSHDELMQTGGKYAEMFLKQAEKYNF